jgi:hypothetical protein
MRKTYALIVLLLVLTKAYSQCSPDLTLTTPGTFPAVLTNACVNAPYTDTATIVFKEDSVLFGFTLLMDSMIITNVIGLPAGLNYSCGNGSCAYISQPPELTYGCLLIQGTPTTITTSGYNFQIVVEYWVTIPFIGGYSFTDTSAVGLNINNCAGIESVTDPAISIYPNPAHDQLLIQIGEGILSSDCIMQMYNSTGQLVRTTKLTALSSIIQLNDLNEGMYFIKLESRQGIIMREHVLIQK